MQSSWPTAISAPLVLAIFALLAAQLTLFNATVLDRRANFALGGLAVACALREPTWQHAIISASGGWLSEAFLYQFAMAGMSVVGAVNILTIGTVLGIGYRAGPLVGLGVISAALALICGSAARAEGVMIEQAAGWGALGFWMSLLPLTWWMDVLLVRICLAEFRKRVDARDFVVYGAGATFVLLLGGGFVCAPIAAIYQISGRDTVFARIQAAIDRDVLLYQAVLFAAVVSIPVVAHLADRLGIDRDSRHRRRLLPLWTDLTAACPEIVYHAPSPAALGSRYLLHRTVIEIRDCLRILSRYTEQDDAGPADEVMAFAIRIAHACAAKSRGEPPVGSAVPLPSTAEDVGGEIAELTALAACWTRARALAVAAARPLGPTA
ncbi:MAB_1171c family putative transporter [Nocardia sp. NPDC052566]|uniref:MAB_1171c family putative transporter n=1 Tax=Nocardia sp. NPDC052566 TaxID=3364330 RepID=UPI0037C7D677